jgi:hypothetical protein
MEAHKALVGADAACADPELYGPLAAALERTVRWLRDAAQARHTLSRAPDPWIIHMHACCPYAAACNRAQ